MANERDILKSLAAPRVPTDWTEHDRHAAHAFFRTQTGQRLLSIFRNTAVNATMMSVHGKPDQIVAQAAEARSWQKAFNNLCQLSDTSPMAATAPDFGQSFTASPDETNESETNISEGEADFGSTQGSLGSPIYSE